MSENGKTRMAEAGMANLALHNERVSQGQVGPGALKHGGFSCHVAKRYSDRRTAAGKRLQAIMDGLVGDLGGPSEVSNAQQLILANIRAKLIVLLQINDYVDGQPSALDGAGALIPCLGKSYISFSESLRRDIEALFALKRRRAPLSYAKALRSLEGGKS